MTRTPSLHLVAGFLGSGKTTAIINACKILTAENLRVGVITNDQGKYLVDTAFFRLSDLPAVEVRGGCFCCNFVDLEKQLDTLLKTVQPDLIFAESVGSCGDLVATVVKPLKEFKHDLVTPSSFSVFADARLLRMRLLNIPLPFSDEVVYIFDQQIAETNLLVINKIDLVKPAQLEEIKRLAQLRFPEKVLLPQVSLSEAGITNWLNLIRSAKTAPIGQSLDMDYARYGQGEQRLAWLDEHIRLRSKKIPMREAAIHTIAAVMDALKEQRLPIGHVKFLLSGEGDQVVKVSFTTLEQPGWLESIPELNGNSLDILINGRVECSPNQIKELVYNAVRSSAARDQVEYEVLASEAFHPAEPVPTHRM